MKKELKNTFSWSVSRDSTFRECPRKYYFKHYGHWGGWEKNTPQRTRETYVLGKLAHRPTWIGQVVHECIARSLQNLSRGVPLLGEDEILSITRNRMRQDFRQSRDGKYWQNPKHYYGLFEHEYDIDVSDAEWRDAAETVDHCLKNFYASESFDKLRALDPADYLEVEQLSSCDFDGTQMRIKLDCASREGHDVVIWDWKTGRREATSGLSLQMACYAFYAQQRFSVPLRHLVTRRLDLYRSKLHEQTITQAELNESLSYIRGSIKDMLALLENPAENVADEENFHKVERADVCRRCNFLKVCKPNI